MPRRTSRLDRLLSKVKTDKITLSGLQLVLPRSEVLKLQLGDPNENEPMEVAPVSGSILHIALAVVGVIVAAVTGINVFV